MGLAAQQCRLLTITGRKSDCEFRSMALSHEKIALARNMTDISNEYENSLNQTKLVYDFYGSGDQSLQLSYGLMMKPSALNDYLPIILTDSANRVVLDKKYAAAARAAGIPQEGISGLPSDVMRNAFIEGMYGQGLVTSAERDMYTSIPYNQLAGVGSDSLVTVTTKTGNINDLLTALKEGADNKYAINGIRETLGADAWLLVDGNNTQSTNFTLYDLLSNNKTVNMAITDPDGHHVPRQGMQTLSAAMTSDNGFIDWIHNEFSQILNTGDSYVANALNYAKSMCKNDFDWLWDDNSHSYSTKIAHHADTYKNKAKVNEHAASNYGLVYAENGTSGRDSKRNPSSGVNLNNIADAYLTYFAKYMEGIATADNYDVKRGNMNGQNIVTNDITYLYTLYVGAQFSAESAKMAAFYDTIFNQLCSRGWVENQEVNDNQYLQEMLQGGKMFMTRIKDDGYYYQGNYSTDTYVKEVVDETAIAKAEARYTSEKNKLNQKEQTLDLRMKNLDTEISALNTEYDSVKSTINKNIEKSFKRYSA